VKIHGNGEARGPEGPRGIGLLGGDVPLPHQLGHLGSALREGYAQQ